MSETDEDDFEARIAQDEELREEEARTAMTSAPSTSKRSFLEMVEEEERAACFDAQVKAQRGDDAGPSVALGASQADTTANAFALVAPSTQGSSAPPGYASEEESSEYAAEALDAGQQAAFDLALSGANLFLTGGPGTGKSFTLRKIIDALKEKHGECGVLVAAPTGVAALIAEGQTLHSKPGPGVPKGTTEAFGNMKSRSSFDFWRRIKVLVIDEISMVDAEFLGS